MVCVFPLKGELSFYHTWQVVTLETSASITTALTNQRWRSDMWTYGIIHTIGNKPQIYLYLYTDIDITISFLFQ